MSGGLEYSREDLRELGNLLTSLKRSDRSEWNPRFQKPSLLMLFQKKFHRCDEPIGLVSAYEAHVGMRTQDRLHLASWGHQRDDWSPSSDVSEHLARKRDPKCWVSLQEQ